MRASGASTAQGKHLARFQKSPSALQVRPVTRQGDTCAFPEGTVHIKAQVVTPATERATQEGANLMNTHLAHVSVSQDGACPIGEE